MSNRRRDRSSLCSEPSLFTTTRSAAEYSERAENQHCYEGTHPEITRFRCDCLAERGGFEPAVSRETFAKENPRDYWRNFASRSVSILQRASSPSVRHEFRR